MSPRERKHVAGKSDSTIITKEILPQKSTVAQLAKTFLDISRLSKIRIVFTEGNFIQSRLNWHHHKLLPK
jgi:hypothetical protein